jgi:lysylphosphatidylglycerol synthetase-like protein (DUF2156 family)
VKRGRPVSSVTDAIQSYGDNPSAFLALNSGNEYFTVPGLAGGIVYRTAGRYLVQFAGPFAPDDTYAQLLRRFLDFAAGQRRRVVGVQLQRQDAIRYAEHGFTVNQLGSSYAVDLSRFTLRGSRFMRLRNKIARAARSGVVVDEEDLAGSQHALADIDRDWLRSKGRHAKPLQFLVGEATGGMRRLFMARIEGEPIGYITYSPVYGSRPGWMHDLSRRRMDVPPGVMEAINSTAIGTFQQEQVSWLHFGFTPFVGLDPALEVGAASPLVSRIVRLLAEHGNAVYPAASQLAYKEKWSPHAVLPEYLAFQGRPRVGAVYRLLRVTNAL